MIDVMLIFEGKRDRSNFAARLIPGKSSYGSKICLFQLLDEDIAAGLILSGAKVIIDARELRRRA
jgi:hypothetical protein